MSKRLPHEKSGDSFGSEGGEEAPYASAPNEEEAAAAARAAELCEKLGPCDELNALAEASGMTAEAIEGGKAFLWKILDHKAKTERDFPDKERSFQEFKLLHGQSVGHQSLQSFQKRFGVKVFQLEDGPVLVLTGALHKEQIVIPAPLWDYLHAVLFLTNGMPKNRKQLWDAVKTCSMIPEGFTIKWWGLREAFRTSGDVTNYLAYLHSLKGVDVGPQPGHKNVDAAVRLQIFGGGGGVFPNDDTTE